MVAIDPIFDPKATTIPVLRYLVAVADHLHFGRAADACGVAQPTLSAQIAQWERRMRMQVFERSGTGVRTTPAGERVIAAARQALSELARVEAAAALTGPAPFHGPVRLGVIPTVGPYVLPLVCPALEAAFPGLELPVQEGQTAQLLELLARGRIDVLLLALLPGMADDHGTLPLYDEPFLLAVPAAHRLAKRDSIALADLAHERLLLLDEGHCLRDQALDLCKLRDDGERLGADYRATSLETLRQLVAAGVGCTLLPSLASDYAADGRVAVRPLKLQRGSRTIGLVWRRGDARAKAYPALGPAIRRALPRERVRVL